MGRITRWKLTCLVLGTSALLSACAEADSDASTAAAGATRLRADGSRILTAVGTALTPPSVDAPEAVAQRFVFQRAAVAAPSLEVTERHAGRDGITHVRLVQTVEGLPVLGTYARVAVSAEGEVLHASDRLAEVDGPLGDLNVDADAALSAALHHLGFSSALRMTPAARKGRLQAFSGGPTFFRDPTVEEVVYRDAEGFAQRGYQVETWTNRDNRLDRTLVDADGAVVSVEHRTANDSYNVFVEDPGKGAQAVVNGPGAGNAQSPSGWLSGAQTTINIQGNNAKAYLDTDANNAADVGGSAVANGNFLTAVDLATTPSGAGNKAVAVQNLFYFNNVMHDVLYRHGFNEAAGNFQTNNFGLGGVGNDPVLAEAQDGSGTDNANFATPADGSSPRMQMYLWTSPLATGQAVAGGTTSDLWISGFGTAPTTVGTSAPLAIYNDGSGVTSDACELAVASLTGKIALIDRGTCNFTVKVLNAQKAGAVGAILIDNVAEAGFAPGGTDRKIKIPSGMVTQAVGATLRGLVGQAGTIRKKAVQPIQLDGDLDGDIVFHEYGHGLTWRMIGSMSGMLAGAIGEGASDVNAFLNNGDDIMGEYAISNPAGIRRYRYQGYPLTYSAVTGAEVHDDGEIYAGAMWRVLQNYLAAGLTADDCYGDFVDGMNFTPAAPAYEDMRDGMLQAVAGSGRECLVWRGFAASGIGVGADGAITVQGRLRITESFTLPAACP